MSRFLPEGPKEVEYMMSVVRSADSLLSNEIFGKYRKEGLVDYMACAQDRRYRDFCRIIAELQNAQLESYSREEKIPFLINVYNDDQTRFRGSRHPRK